MPVAPVPASVPEFLAQPNLYVMAVVEQMHDDTDRADIDVLSQMYVDTPAARTAQLGVYPCRALTRLGS